MSDISAYTTQNRRAWNEIAHVRSTQQQPAEFFAQGHSTLDVRELEAVGDVQGKSLLHLMCATGEDTLSWAVAGAQTIGVDISEVQIRLAQQKAVDAGLPVRFIASDIYMLPANLQAASFDYVYTGKGVLVWLPDIVRWAEIVAAALKRGGTFLLFEEHPIAMCLWVDDGKLTLTGDYFGREKPEQSTGWGHFRGSEQAQETKVEFSWPLGDIVTALAQAGLRIERLQEFPAETSYRFNTDNEHLEYLPGNFLLLARKR